MKITPTNTDKRRALFEYRLHRRHGLRPIEAAMLTENSFARASTEALAQGLDGTARDLAAVYTAMGHYSGHVMRRGLASEYWRDGMTADIRARVQSFGSALD